MKAKVISFPSGQTVPPQSNRSFLFVRRAGGNARIWSLSLTAITSLLLITDPVLAEVQQVEIGTLHGQMKFDRALFVVRPGTTVRLTLKNSDEMQHNLVILVPGENKPLEIAKKAWELGPDAVRKAFVPDDPDVLFHTRVLDPQQSDTITFVAPEKEGEYPFVCTLPGHVFSMKGTMRVSKTDAVAVVNASPTHEEGPAPRHLHVMERPLLVRAFVEGGPPRSISVGLPGGINYLFDADACYVRFGWSGMFLDVGPNVGTGPGDRGGGWCKILGEKFEVGDSGFPISLKERDVRHSVKFEGYRMREKEVPQLFFTIDGNRVTQTIRPAVGGVGIQSEFEFEHDPGRLFYYVSGQGIEVSSTAGKWDAGRLEIPAGESRKFAVTMIRQSRKSGVPKVPVEAP